MDWSAPPMIWLQVDTSGDNEDRSQPIPADCVGEMSWCHESIGGQEVRYVREDLAVQPRLHSSEAFDLLVAVARAAHAAMDDAETGSDHRTALEPAAAQVLSDALDALDELPEIPDPDRVYDGWARAAYFALQAGHEDVARLVKAAGPFATFNSSEPTITIRAPTQDIRRLRHALAPFAALKATGGES